MNDSTPATVKCQDCGFLCVRSNAGELVEVPYDIRQGWPINNPFFQTHNNRAVCFALALPEQEWKRVLTGASQSLEIVQESRECTCFTAWRQGFTPKEHAEMVQSAELRAWLDEQKRRDQEREDRLEAERERRRQEERERERQWLEQQRLKDQERDAGIRRWQVKWQFIITAIGAVIGAFLAFMLTVVAIWLGIK
jgi:hypothetical protein